MTLANELKKMPERTKEIFVLHILEGRSRQKISDMLGISIKAVEKHILKAVINLKNKETKKTSLEEQANYWLNLETEGCDLNKIENFSFWINKNQENRKVYLEQKQLLNEINELPSTIKEDIKKEVKETRKTRSKLRKVKIVGLPLFALVSVLTLLYFAVLKENIIFSKDYLLLDEIQSNIVLPDNTKIDLDVNTPAFVKYYDDKREVFLSDGKALFDVREDKDRPFTLRLERVNINVIGTKFEIICENKELIINVLEGNVRVANKRDKLLALVTQGQTLTLDKYLTIKSLKKQENKNIALWSQGKLEFSETLLLQAVQEFSKYLDINVEIERKELETLAISGKYDIYNFQEFLDSLMREHPIEVVQNQNKTFIKLKVEETETKALD